MESDQKEKLWNITKHYGFDRQIEQAIEEASEFILAAQKWKRFHGNNQYQNLIEETCDLIIMMEEMRILLDPGWVDSSVAYKINREITRIESES